MSVDTLFLIPTLNLGGAERSLIKAVTHLAGDGCQIVIAVLSRGNNGISGELPANVRVVYMNSDTTASPLLWWRIRCLIKSISPRLVCGWSTYANLVALVSSIGVNEVRVGVSERNFLPRMLGRERVSGVRRSVLKFAIRTLYRRAHVISANSRQSLCALRRYIGGEAEYLLLPNLVDIDRLDRLAAQMPDVPDEDAFVTRIVCVGRLDAQKGFDVLLRSLVQVEPHWAWRLVIVGDGPLRGQLEALTRRLRFRAGQVVLAPSTANPFPFYRWADIVVVPSRFEGFPNVALEAMALGKPIIASRCRSGPSELTCNGRYGVLVKPENTEELADAVLKMCIDSSMRVRFGTEGRQHVLRNYTWDAVSQNYTRLLAT